MKNPIRSARTPWELCGLVAVLKKDRRPMENRDTIHISELLKMRNGHQVRMWAPELGFPDLRGLTGKAALGILAGNSSPIRPEAR
jgi:hypothetical protein